MKRESLTGLSVQKLLEFTTLILNRLPHKMRPDVADSKVGHVHLHQVQHRENVSVKQGRINETSISVEQVCSGSIFILRQNCCKNQNCHSLNDNYTMYCNWIYMLICKEI